MKFWNVLQSGRRYLAIIVIAGIMFGIAQPVFAQTTPTTTTAPAGASAATNSCSITTVAISGIGGAIQECAVYILSLPVQALGFILHYELDTLIVVLDYQTHNNKWIISSVYDTWYIIRNFINMFFIIVMIVMAIATVLSYEKYSYKKLLMPLIITALIINFSFTVGQNFIIFGNELASTFAKQINLNNLGDMFMQTTGIYRLPPSTGTTNTILPTKSTKPISPIFNALIAELFFIIYGIIAVLAILTVLVTSIIRIPALWIILIMAPIAWLGYAVPNFKFAWTRWWKELTSWTFFLPIYMFCLIFAFGFLSAKTTFNFGGQSGDALYGINDIFFYILTLVIFVGGLSVARSLGSAAGVGTTWGFDKVEKFFGVSSQQLQQGKGFGGRAVRLVGTLGQEDRFNDYRAGFNKAKDARLNVIKEKGLFGIGGSEQSKLRQAKVAERFSGGLLKGTEDKAKLDAIGSNRTRISKLLESKPDDASKKKFLLDNINSNDKITSQAARLEYAKKYNDITKIKEDLDAVGGKDTPVGKELFEIYKKKLDEPKFATKDQKQAALRNEGPFKDLNDFRKEATKDLQETNQIRTREDYEAARELFKNSTKELNALNNAIEKINPVIRIESTINNDPKNKDLSQGERDVQIFSALKNYVNSKSAKDLAQLDASFFREERAQNAIRAVAGGKDSKYIEQLTNAIAGSLDKATAMKPIFEKIKNQNKAGNTQP